MGEAVYAIDDFPDDDLLWRIEWIGGVGYNTSVPSDPLMDVYDFFRFVRSGAVERGRWSITVCSSPLLSSGKTGS